MDGENSDMFQYFKILILRGLIAARKHCDQIIHIVELMRMGTFHRHLTSSIWMAMTQNIWKPIFFTGMFIRDGFLFIYAYGSLITITVLLQAANWPASAAAAPCPRSGLASTWARQSHSCKHSSIVWSATRNTRSPRVFMTTTSTIPTAYCNRTLWHDTIFSWSIGFSIWLVILLSCQKSAKLVRMRDIIV